MNWATRRSSTWMFGASPLAITKFFCVVSVRGDREEKINARCRPEAVLGELLQCLEALARRWSSWFELVCQFLMHTA